VSDAVDRGAIPDAPAALRQLGDGAAVALAVATWLGARSALAVPVAVGGAVVAVALVGRRPVLLVLGCGVLAAGLGARSLAGLVPPDPRPVDAVATLVADPVAGDFDVRGEVRLDGRRLLVRADGGAGGSLRSARMGERVRVVGRLRPRPPGAAWMIPRHLAGQIDATSVEVADAGGPPWRAANRVRALIEQGARGMDRDDRSLYLGFVLGDDREQAATLVDDFRGSGLSHLMVVSGQNVAFILVLIGPVRTRLGWSGRWLVTLGVVVAFAAITRFEPSVLRASAMAVVAVSGQAVGRPAPAWRNLALAVTAMVLLDPLLTRSVGFQLSVAATAAISLLAAPLAALLPGPRPVALAVATSASAQLGVAPILAGFAGGVPVTSLPANVLVGPAAALVTTYGLPAGLVAGVLGDPWAAPLHLPTVAGVRWAALVARAGATAPLGELSLRHLAGLVLLAVVARWRPRLRSMLAVLAVAVLVLPALALRSPPLRVAVGSGGSVWRSGGATVVVLPGRSRPATVLRDLRRAGVRRIDVLVVAGSSAPLLGPLRHRWTVAKVVDDDARPGTLRVGDLEVVVRPPADAEVRRVPP